MASRWLWCIFQLPLMSGLRGSGLAGIRRLSKGLQAGKVALLEVLEGGAPTGGDVVDVVVETELGEGGGAVATADDGEAVGVGHGLGDGAGASLEPRVLEHAHRAVPEDRSTLG